MSSIYRFQMNGFKISLFNLSYEILPAKATAIFVPMAVPGVCRQSFP